MPSPAAHPLPALETPSVSIVICNHNYARFLGEAIDSALLQEPPCQVIVVDDGSTDGSRDFLAHASSRVDVVLQANAGQLVAYESGLARCRGDVVIFLDADDALEVGAAAALRGRFSSGVAKVHCRLTLVDEGGVPLGGTVPSILAEGNVLAALTSHGVLYPSAPGSGNAYRRSVLCALFPLPGDASDRVGADFFTIYGAAAFGTVAACPEAWVRYRIHRKADTSSAETLVFGNAALGNDEAAKVKARYARMGPWLAQRTGGAVHLPDAFLDFSVQKSPFAMNLLARSYLRALTASGDLFMPLLRSIWLQKSYGLRRQLMLTAWALLLAVAPRAAAWRMARFVCNPARRAA